MPAACDSCQSVGSACLPTQGLEHWCIKERWQTQYASRATESGLEQGSTPCGGTESGLEQGFDSLRRYSSGSIIAVLELTMHPRRALPKGGLVSMARVLAPCCSSRTRILCQAHRVQYRLARQEERLGLLGNLLGDATFDIGPTLQ